MIFVPKLVHLSWVNLRPYLEYRGTGVGIIPYITLPFAVVRLLHRPTKNRLVRQ